MQVSTETAKQHRHPPADLREPTSSAGDQLGTAQECAGPVGRSRSYRGTRLSDCRYDRASAQIIRHPQRGPRLCPDQGL